MHVSIIHQSLVNSQGPDDGQHQNKFYRLPGLFSAPFHARLTSLADFLFGPTPLGSLFTGYHGDLSPFTTCSFFLIDNRTELQTPVIIVIFYFLIINLLFLFSSLVELSY